MTTKRVLFSSLCFAAALVFLAQAAQARLTPQTPAEPVSLSTNLSNLGDCCAPKAPCCPKPCITYRHRGPKLCCGCEAPVKTVLKVKDPCTCCEIEVPVCLPACCKGEPTVCCGAGFLGRDVVTYEWCCGFSVRVAFKHSGDLIVTTWGR
jgi:hypothetical protein